MSSARNNQLNISFIFDFCCTSQQRCKKGTGFIMKISLILQSRSLLVQTLVHNQVTHSAYNRVVLEQNVISLSQVWWLMPVIPVM
jgi:hypothetical protein